MGLSRWTPERLERLFRRYNSRYWRGRIPQYAVVDQPHGDAFGYCDKRRRQITVNVKMHKNDTEVRETLLHEMAHAADRSRSKIAHGYGFWREIERLLRMGVQIKVGIPEMPHMRIFSDAIPSRFPLCRKAAQRVEAARGKEVADQIRQMETKAGKPIEEQIITDDYIVSDFEDAATVGRTWREAIAAIGPQYGLVDVELRPANRWARRILVKAKRVHLRTLREWRKLDRIKKKRFGLQPVS